MAGCNFDEIIERRGSGAIKSDCLAERFGRDDLIAAWVADMDFATPSFIIDDLEERLRHPILGYTAEPADYRPAIIDWQKNSTDGTLSRNGLAISRASLRESAWWSIISPNRETTSISCPCLSSFQDYARGKRQERGQHPFD